MSELRFLATCMMVLLMTACASAPPKGRAVEARVVASQDVNPDRFGVASPITVRVIQLRSDAQFRRVELEALFDNPQTSLGSDFVAYEDLVLRPGDRHPLALDLRPETEFVAAAAAFQASSRTNWKDLRRAPKKSLLPDVLGSEDELVIVVTRDRIAFVGEDP